jgi:hypothetical protein
MKKDNDSVTFRKVYTYATYVAGKEVEKKFFAADINNVHIVFFNPEDRFPVKGFNKIVERKNKKSHEIFYGMRASKYGTVVPKSATHMALAVFGKRKIERLYTMEIPRPLSKTVVSFGKDSEYSMHVRRSNSNVFVAIGKGPSRSTSRKTEARNDINEKWVQL